MKTRTTAFPATLLIAALSLTQLAPAQTQPIGWWIFDKDHINDRTVTDKTGAHNAAIEGPVKLIDKPLPALAFDGQNNSITVPGVDASHLPKCEISAEAWISLDAGTRWGCFVGYAQDNGSYEKGWLLGYNETHFNLAVSTAGSLTYLTSSTAFQTNQWYHVVGTYDGKTMKIYVNGKLDNASASQSGNVDYPPKAIYTIGAYRDDDEFFRCHGKLHEVRVYDKVLRPGEILAHYKVVQNRLPKPLKFTVTPYLQFITPDSAFITWETPQPTAAVLTYGKAELLDKCIEASSPDTRHQITIESLEPKTLYSYRIEATAGKTQHISDTYEFDTAFNYTVVPISPNSSPYPNDATAKLYADAAQHILSQSNVTKGYCLVYGSAKGQLAYQLAKRSQLIIIGVDDDANKVAEARKLLQKAGVYGPRITIRHVTSLDHLPITSNFANLIVSDRVLTDGRCPGSATEMVRVLRPGGGVACIGQPTAAANQIEKNTLDQWLETAKLEYGLSASDAGIWAKLVRPPLEHAGTWTHQYGDPTNAANSGDTLQGATRTTDMQVQWIGRPGADFGIDRNPRMPAPLSVNGRLFHQGLNRIIALDAYNGAILWSLEIPDLRRVNIPRDASNWCADENRLYVAIKNTCWVLDAATGKLVTALPLPDENLRKTHDWGYLARAGDKLFGSSVKAGSSYTAFYGNAMWYDGGRKGPADATTYKVCSHNLFACSPDTAKPTWTYTDGLIINTTIAIGSGRLYFVESRHPDPKAEKTGRVRSPKLWADQYLVALNADTGSKLWQQPVDTADGNVVFFLVCTDETLIIASSTSGKYHLYAYDAGDGTAKWKAEHPWTGDNHGGHMQHPVIAGNVVYLEPCGYDLKTGNKVTTKMGRHEGCATYAGTKGAFIYRGKGRCIAMWDPDTGTISTWHNLRPSCWLSVIPSAGMVLAPEGGGGCSCGNWLETSLGFAPKANLNDR